MTETITPKVGDFVQLNTWFGDVWSEVFWVSGNLFKSVQYEKGRCDTIHSHLHFTDSIRAIRTRDELNFNRDIIYGVYEYWRYGEQICGK